MNDRSDPYFRRLNQVLGSFQSRLRAPSNFSLSSNITEVLRYIARLEKCLKEEKSVFVLMHKVERVDLDAIVLLLGIMAEFNAKKVKFNGNFPKNSSARKKLEESGFFQELYPDEHIYEFGTKRGIYTHGNVVMDQQLTFQIIVETLSDIFGSKRRSQGAQRILIEAMKNTIEHADIKGKPHWWLSVKTDVKEKVATFSFLDYGVGVFESLRQRDPQDPGYSWFTKYMKLGVKNSTILRKIMNGELLHVSRTRDPKHGTGFPGMKSSLDNNFVSKLVILSNDVYADISNDLFNQLDVNFSGTFIQFQIIESCKTFDYD